MSTHNICFCGEIRKISRLLGQKKAFLSRAVYIDTFLLSSQKNIRSDISQ